VACRARDESIFFEHVGPICHMALLYKHKPSFGVMSMRKVKIVCTLGPACSDHTILAALAREGMDVARFNFSHGTYEQHGKN